MQIQQEPFKEESFFFELINKLNQSEIQENKYRNNFSEPPHPKIYYTCFIFDEVIKYNQRTKLDGKNVVVNLHTQKALVVSSFFLYYVEFYEILKAIKKCIDTNLIGFELEKVIHSLVFDIPAPTPGMSKVSYDYSSLFKVEFELNRINNIPKAVSDLKIIFNLLNIRKIFDILKFIILEVPVIIFCSDKFTLANAVKSFEELLLPFTYPYSVIEILPKTYYKSLEKLSCFIVGINQKYSSDFFEVNNINLNDKEYVTVTLSEQEPDYNYVKKNINKYGILLKDYNKNMQKNKMTEKYLIKDVTFPKHYQTKFMKKLNRLFNGKSGCQIIINDVLNDDIRYQFYYFFTSMLQHYKSFLVNDSQKLLLLYTKVENDTIDLNDLFKFQEFILKTDDSIDFFNFFMATRIWKNFLIKNIYPSTIDEKLEVLLLDENIRKKKNKNMIKSLFKENTPFLETNKFDFKNVENIRIAYDKGEVMYLASIQPEIQKDFPLLNNEKMESLFKQNFLLSNSKVKNLYKDFYKECLNILKDKKFLEGYNNIGYKINLSDELISKQENFILKLWFLLICYVFKYLENGEKWILFNELLKEIQSMTIPYRIFIFDHFFIYLMFSTFIEYGDKLMCSLLYKELGDIPCVKEDYLTFTQLHKKFMSKKDEFKFTLPKKTLLKERNFNLYDLPKGNKISIDIVGICSDRSCKVSAELKNNILNFTSMQTDEIKFTCTICHKVQNAKFKVSTGNSPSDKFSYQLYTPKYLFYYIKNLGDYNMNTFYKTHTEIFFNLIILFQLRIHSYDFLFPYKDIKQYPGFDPKKLEVKKAGEDKFIYKNIDENKKKWYENIVGTQLKQRRFSKLIPSRKGSVCTFRTFEPLSSMEFFQKNSSNINKKKSRRFSALKHSKTLVEN